MDILDGTDLQASMPASREALQVTFVFRFQLDDDESLDFIVVDSPANPIHDNGTAGQSGWWTDLVLMGNGGTTEYEAMTEGTQWLGDLPEDIPLELRLKVTVPAAALNAGDDWHLTYRLAEHRSGFFGRPDSMDLQARIVVVEPASLDEAPAASGSGWTGPQIALAAIAGLAAIGTAAGFRWPKS